MARVDWIDSFVAFDVVGDGTWGKPFVIARFGDFGYAAFDQLSYILPNLDAYVFERFVPHAAFATVNPDYGIVGLVRRIWQDPYDPTKGLVTYYTRVSHTMQTSDFTPTEPF